MIIFVVLPWMLEDAEHTTSYSVSCITMAWYRP